MENMCGKSESERESQKKLNVMKHTSGNVIHFVFVLLKKRGKNVFTNGSQCIKVMCYVCSADASK